MENTSVDNLHVDVDQKAWLDGIKAFEYGYKRTENPYEGKQANDWVQGYETAEAVLALADVKGHA